MVNRYDYASVIVVMVCIFLVVDVQSEIFQIEEKRNGIKYCGTKLSNILSSVCNGNYNTHKLKKSSYGMDNIESDEDYQQLLYLDDPKLPFPYRSRSRAAALLSGSFRRYTRGVSDECCKKSCSISELKSYCNN